MTPPMSAPTLTVVDCVGSIGMLQVATVLPELPQVTAATTGALKENTEAGQPEELAMMALVLRKSSPSRDLISSRAFVALPASGTMTGTTKSYSTVLPV